MPSGVMHDASVFGLQIIGGIVIVSPPHGMYVVGLHAATCGASIAAGTSGCVTISSCGAVVTIRSGCA